MEAAAAAAANEEVNDGAPQEEDSDEEQEQQQQDGSNDNDNTNANNQQPCVSALGPTDPDRMRLTEEEREWALAIKRAVKTNPELEMIPTDFMIAQLAIVHKDDVATAIEVCHRIQETRQEYNITDTYEDAVVKLQKSLELNVGIHMYFGYNHEERRYVAVFDVGRFDARVAMDKHNSEYCFGGAWYCYHALSPDFESVRRGAIFLTEIQGYSWAPRHVDLAYAKKYWSDVAGVYPLVIHRFKCFDTPTVFNIVKALCKPLMPPHIEPRVQVGCQYDGRLDSLYLVPSVQVARQRVLVRMLECLQRRFAAEKSFTLS